MTTWLQDENSTYDNRVIELYVFTSPITTWYMTTYNRDFTFGGHTYLATPGLTRGPFPNYGFGGGVQEVVVELPFEHVLARKCIGGLPPREIQVTIARYQQTSGISVQMWQGYITSSAVRDRLAQVRVPSGFDDAMVVEVPGWAASRTCNNILYDANCTQVRGPIQIATTISAIGARTVTVPVMALPNSSWLNWGEILHNASTERRQIRTHTTTLLNLNLNLPVEAQLGDAVTIFPGCDHTMDGQNGCANKFANAINFNGHPQLPVSNPFVKGVVLTVG